MLKAIIFDFDGVILDTETHEFVTWQETYREHGAELSLDIWADCVGRPNGYFDPYAHLESLAGRSVDREAIRKARNQKNDALNAAAKPLPGVEEYIRRGKNHGLNLSIASSSSHHWVEKHLHRLGLIDFFNLIICREDTAVHKPDPAPYREALRRLGISPDEAVAIEDSPNGIKAAKAAGLFCIAVPNAVTRSLVKDEADIKIESLEDLPFQEMTAVFMKKTQTGKFAESPIVSAIV